MTKSPFLFSKSIKKCSKNFENQLRNKNNIMPENYFEFAIVKMSAREVTIDNFSFKLHQTKTKLYSIPS